MIIVRSPLRISLGGGGTDLPSYYGERGGFLVAGAIDKYVYITLHESFREEFILRYSAMEKVEPGEAVKHPIVREALDLLKIPARRLEISSMADVPSGTGLGSSGSFTTALLRALHAHKRDFVDPQALAEEACHIEMERLGEPVGKQDQYISACGGLSCFSFAKDGQVTVEPLQMARQDYFTLEDNLLLFFTGYARSAGGILKDQDQRSRQNDPAMLANLDRIKALGLESRQALESGDLQGFARMMNEHWQEKRRRSPGMSSPQIEAWYDLALRNGALGGKLIGAGGGGFLMFYTEDRVRLRAAMREAGLEELRFRFEPVGTQVLVS